ncbi:NAD(P)-dependent oxidoreductase [Shewanella sp. C32]|uniref:NAD(P)-dependent oxidoreductase n=1 Tax=Shewanella electrica TaxID=515560 RepID=A0ABT2FJJ9_9GAMM|nr:NAD(P)-dependent oxidoreductase [Shewanella electrica]MCH1924608.1 NAD(P)-dependent oxidoreductase [Shewanella electrica]MCS4556509.1 NAD(P)-dependent oxidoreductase [Shewanella electrica]
MRILITGISGFLGSHLANALISKHELAGTVRAGSNLERVNDKDNLELINIDCVDWIEKIRFFNPDIVINTAALYGRKKESLSELIEANIIFPQKIIECIRTDSTFINCGTSLPSSVSFYSLTKNQFIELAKEYCKITNIKFVNLRLEHFFGANDDPTKFTSYVINQCLSGLPLNLTEGIQERDFIYIDDLIIAFKCIVDSLEELDYFESIDIGSGNTVKVKDFVKLVASITSSKSIIEFGAIPMRENELMFSCAEIQRIKSLGWKPKYDLVSAIKDMINKE